MTKAKATKTARAQQPEQTRDADPAAPPADDAQALNSVHDPAGAPPPPPPDEPERAVVLVDVRRLEVAQALPEVPAEADTLPTAFNLGSIERFKSTDTDRRTMDIVALPDGSLAKRAVVSDEA